jgi:RNA polymerase sigma-70 factor, ECF subfamily
MSEPNEDVIWVARCLRGDTRAFEALVHKHQRALFALALHLMGDYEDARDATQNTFIRAYERLETFDPNRKFFSWIYRIAVNECLNLKRARRVHEPVTEALEAGSPLRDALETDELSVIVRKALAELTSEQREVVILKYFADLSYGEISQTLGVPEKTIKSRLFEARQRLGARLGTSRGHTR